MVGYGDLSSIARATTGSGGFILIKLINRSGVSFRASSSTLLNYYAKIGAKILSENLHKQLMPDAGYLPYIN